MTVFTSVPSKRILEKRLYCKDCSTDIIKSPKEITIDAASTSEHGACVTKKNISLETPLGVELRQTPIIQVEFIIFLQILKCIKGGQNF